MTTLVEALAIMERMKEIARGDGLETAEHDAVIDALQSESDIQGGVLRTLLAEAQRIAREEIERRERAEAGLAAFVTAIRDALGADYGGEEAHYGSRSPASIRRIRQQRDEAEAAYHRVMDACAHRDPASPRRCTLPLGHDGEHGDGRLDPVIARAEAAERERDKAWGAIRSALKLSSDGVARSLWSPILEDVVADSEGR